MFSKILIANRGEIACRVIRTAKRMGIATVAVYSDADAHALHARMADERVHIGTAPSADSYLRIDRIVEACQRTGAEAVHPGYGFLSENDAFCKALQEAGITFIGPGIRAIDVMGDKITSKQLAADAGVSTIPGYTDVIDGPDHAVAIAREIGYPVMLKASAGGGGKGMRVVWNDDDCRDGFERATNEAVSSFGDGRVFAEKFIEEPRHIEIQVLADSHGNTLYLGERECSIQRRHQKVIEEAPSPFLDEATRRAMGEQAVALRPRRRLRLSRHRRVHRGRQQAVLLSRDEHASTGRAPGHRAHHRHRPGRANDPCGRWRALSLQQEDVTLTGWSLEARVYAEDPFRNFLPSIGRLVRYQTPTPSDHVRIDSGIEEGSEVSMYYDPMIAKLITYGQTRDQAIERMGDALDAYYIRGVSHNISFLNALIAHPRFREGRLTTNFIAEEYPDGFNAADVPQANPVIPVLVTAFVHARKEARNREISGQIQRFSRPERRDWIVIADGTHYPVRIDATETSVDIAHDGTTYVLVSDWAFGSPRVHLRINGRACTVQLEAEDGGYRLWHAGREVRAMVLNPAQAELTRHMIEREPPDLSKFLLSPMPGLLVRLAVAEGDEVKAGEELAVIEAMKMENSLRAASDGVVAKVLVEEGASLEVDAAILEFE